MRNWWLDASSMSRPNATRKAVVAVVSDRERARCCVWSWRTGEPDLPREGCGAVPGERTGHGTPRGRAAPSAPRFAWVANAGGALLAGSMRPPIRAARDRRDSTELTSTHRGGQSFSAPADQFHRRAVGLADSPRRGLLSHTGPLGGGWLVQAAPESCVIGRGADQISARKRVAPTL